MAGAFVSRNNDVGGYWALGKLYKLAQTSGLSEIRVDLVGSALEPSSPEFADMVRDFRQMLVGQVAARRLSGEWLKAADIRVTFSGKKSARGSGDMFECLVTLTDDLGRRHEARGSGACWAHDPDKERKSGPRA